MQVSFTKPFLVGIASRLTLCGGPMEDPLFPRKRASQRIQTNSYQQNLAGIGTPAKNNMFAWLVKNKGDPKKAKTNETKTNSGEEKKANHFQGPPQTPVE